MNERARQSRKKRVGGKVILSPEDTILTESGKEQLHLILMIMCVFLHKYYVVISDKKQLYPEEIGVIVAILEKIRNQNEWKLKSLFGVESTASLIKEDPERLKKMDTMFRTVNAYENITKFLQSSCVDNDCVITVDVSPTKPIPALSGELFKQTSLKFRLVLFLSDMISLLTKAREEQELQIQAEAETEAKKTNVIKGKVIESKLKMRKEFVALFGIVSSTGYGITKEFIRAANYIRTKWPKPKKTVCKRNGGAINYKKRFSTFIKNTTTRIGSFITAPTSELRDKYAFLLYFKTFTQFYVDNTTNNIRISLNPDKRNTTEYFGKSIYDLLYSTYRLSLKNPLGSTIIIISMITSQILSGLANAQPLYSPIWIASQVASAESSLVPIALAPFVDNPLMPIFRKEDIEKYNNRLIFQAGDTQNLKKIAEIAENYVRIVIVMLKQPMTIQFNTENINIAVLEPEPEKSLVATK